MTRIPRTPRVKKASPRPRGVPAEAAAPPEKSTVEELSVEPPETDEPRTEAPHDEPTHDEPTHDEPTHDEPTHDEPPADEPTHDEPLAEDQDEDGADEEPQPDLPLGIEPARLLPRVHLRGLLEALVFASDKPMTSHELAKLASAPLKEVKEILGELRETYAPRGITLGEVAGGWLFRTNAQFAPFVRELTGEKPVRLSRAQLETLAIAAYRQPITRPEIDEIRGVDSGATMKLLLERELLRILGKKDEPGRPLLYGTTPAFLEFFGLKSLKELPTLREFAELSEESRAVAEAELGEVIPRAQPLAAEVQPEEGQPVEAQPERTPSDREPVEAEATNEPGEVADAAKATDAIESADEGELGDPTDDGALLADVPTGGTERNGEHGSPTASDDAALADVDEGSAADDTAITDPERILGGDE